MFRRMVDLIFVTVNIQVAFRAGFTQFIKVDDVINISKEAHPTPADNTLFSQRVSAVRRSTSDRV
ncbi:MAG: hypothetical protein L7S70_04910 [Pseudomonadales bacterium]|nr:hypothetical protein [Pseudomonadales bacterium]